MSANNPFSSYAANPLGSATGAFDITPNDDSDLATVTRGLSWTEAGTLALVMADGSEIELASGELASNVIHAISVRRVLADGTSATGIKGWT